MLRKIIIFVSILTIIGVAAYVFFYFDKSTQQISSSISIIPVNAAMILEIEDLSEFITTVKDGNQFWQDIYEIKDISELNSQMTFIDSIIKTDIEIEELIKRNSLIISLHLTGKTRYNFIYTIALSPAITQDKIKRKLENIIASKSIIKTREYNSRTIYDIDIKNENYSYSIINNNLCFSESSILIEDAIRQQQTNISLLKDRGFTNVSKTAGKNVDANLYLNYKYFPKLASIFLNNNYRNNINSFTNFANWTELDLNISDEKVLLNGFTYTNDSVNNFLNIFLQQEPISIDIDEVLPASTTVLLVFGISDALKYKADCHNYYSRNGTLKPFEEKINDIKKDYEIDIEETMYSILDNQIAIAYTKINNLDIDEYTFSVIKTISKSKAREKLLSILERYSNKNNTSVESLTYTYKIDEDTEFSIYKMPIPYFTWKVFGDVFSKVETNYFTFYDNYLIFGKSIKTLSNFLYDNVLEKTLNNDIDYNNFIDDLSSKSNFFFFANVTPAKALVDYYFSEDFSSSFEKNIESYKKYQSLGIQFSTNNNMIYNNILLKYNPIYKEKPHTVWESHVENKINIKPKFLINHNNNKSEIFIQDINNNIYLINQEGRILWRNQLSEKITSDIYQIDYYNNNKLQILFSTKSQIHLLDRNGNYVERYPIKLKEHTTNGISLVDYDNNKNYRILVATNNKSVYLYDKEGNIIPGWEFNKTEHIVKSKIQHFRIKDKDYIVFSDTLNTYVLDRKGKIRVDIKNQFIKSANNIFYLENNSTPEKARLVTTTNSGEIVSIYFDGKVSKQKIKEFSEDHYFELKDINGDNKNDYVIADNKSVYVYSQTKKEIMSYKFSSEIEDKPTIYVFPNNERKIGIVSQKENKIYLINSDASLYDGFPLNGNTMFSIGHLYKNNNKFNLIVGSNDSFLYNYEVE